MSPSPRDPNVLKLQDTCWELFVSMQLVQADVFSVGLWDTVLLFLHERSLDDQTLEDLIDGCNSPGDGQWLLEWSDTRPVIPSRVPLLVSAALALIRELQNLVGRNPSIRPTKPPWQFIGSYKRDFAVLPPVSGYVRSLDQKVDLYSNPGRTLVMVVALNCPTGNTTSTPVTSTFTPPKLSGVSGSNRTVGLYATGSLSLDTPTAQPPPSILSPQSHSGALFFRL